MNKKTIIVDPKDFAGIKCVPSERDEEINGLKEKVKARDREIERLRDVMKKVYAEGIQMIGNKPASLVEALYKALEESK